MKYCHYRKLSIDPKFSTFYLFFWPSASFFLKISLLSLVFCFVFTLQVKERHQISNHYIFENVTNLKTPQMCSFIPIVVLLVNKFLLLSYFYCSF